MELKKLELGKEKGKFILKKSSPYYINTIRRIIKNKVPSLAIEEITVHENGSALYDEILAHRLGMIPLTTDLKTYALAEECKCKGNGCARCQLVLSLNKVGPCTVHAEDIKSTDPSVKAVYPKTPIVKLLEGQSLKFEATAVLGIGKKHVKFTPGLLYYQGYPKFTIKQSKDANKCVEMCPKKILELKGTKLKVTDETKCDLCNACVEVCPEAIQVKGSTEDFIITLETWGQLSIRNMLIAAVDVFNKQLAGLQEQIKKIK